MNMKHSQITRLANNMFFDKKSTSFFCQPSYIVFAGVRTIWAVMFAFLLLGTTLRLIQGGHFFTAFIHLPNLTTSLLPRTGHQALRKSIPIISSLIKIYIPASQPSLHHTSHTHIAHPHSSLPSPFMPLHAHRLPFTRRSSNSTPDQSWPKPNRNDPFSFRDQ